LEIKTLVIGGIETNCYLVWDEETMEGVVIDPGGEGERILRGIRELKIKPQAILLTHGHGDHIAAVGVVKEATGAPILIHQKDAEMLINPQKSLLAFMGQNKELPPADRILAEGDQIRFGKVEVKVVHTPGHTPGGVCYLGPGIAFSGDSLFAGSIGRTDFPGGSYDELIQSIQDKLLVLPDETRVYPGHGPQTTIGAERSGNPFL